MIQVENVSKRYGNHTAVENLSFTVNKGQIYGFLGPNGAGKSTTMNIMTGYIAASSGTVKINGFDILDDAKKAKKCIGYLPEVPPLYTDMTVLEYLLFAAELKRVPRKERHAHVEEIIGRTHLAEVKGRLIRNLSKGYKQRVGMAQALIGYPEVLILDEPMVGLDPKQILEMRDLIKELSQKHTILLSSHILSEVSAVCDHIMILSKGKLAASGSPEELQEMMRTKTVLEVTVLGEKARIEEILRDISQIESYVFEPAKEDDSTRVRLSIADNADIRKELSMALAGAGMPVLSMNRLEKSLEDIFLELTEDSVQENSVREDPEALKEEFDDSEKKDAGLEGLEEEKGMDNGAEAENDAVYQDVKQGSTEKEAADHDGNL